MTRRTVLIHFGIPSHKAGMAETKVRLDDFARFFDPIGRVGHDEFVAVGNDTWLAVSPDGHAVFSSCIVTKKSTRLAHTLHDHPQERTKDTLTCCVVSAVGSHTRIPRHKLGHINSPSSGKLTARVPRRREFLANAILGSLFFFLQIVLHAVAVVCGDFTRGFAGAF